jgi:hypothetical protein
MAYRDPPLPYGPAPWFVVRAGDANLDPLPDGGYVRAEDYDDLFLKHQELMRQIELDPHRTPAETD